MGILRSRTPLLAAVVSLAGALQLALMALYAGLHPQPVPTIVTTDFAGPDPSVIAANQGAVMWPALLALLSAVAAVAVLRRPGRFTYLIVGGLGVLMIGMALTLPGWLSALAPLAALIGVTGVADVVLAVIGWVPSEPLPESLPGWPEHHGGI